jgi:hypothetical protein
LPLRYFLVRTCCHMPSSLTTLKIYLLNKHLFSSLFWWPRDSSRRSWRHD